MKINDCRYDKIKFLYKFCKMQHYIEKHGQENAKKANDEKWLKLLAEIKEQLGKYISQLDAIICENKK